MRAIQVIEAADAVVEAVEALVGLGHSNGPAEVTRLHQSIGRYRFVVEQAVEQAVETPRPLPSDLLAVVEPLTLDEARAWLTSMVGELVTARGEAARVYLDASGPHFERLRADNAKLRATLGAVAFLVES